MPTTKTEKVVRSETLTEFSTAVDEHYGEALGFADQVTALVVARTDTARLAARRGEIKIEIDARFRRGNTVVQTGPGKGWYLYETTVTGPSRLAAASYVVKKNHPELWVAARRWKPYVQAAAPEAAALPLGTYRVPPPPTMRDDMVTLMRRYHGDDFDALRKLREDEQAAVAALRKIQARTDWDGSWLNFADGWRICLRRLQFDSEQFRKNEPELWEKYAKWTHQSPSVRVRTIDLGLAMDQGYCDSGDFDSHAD